MIDMENDADIVTAFKHDPKRKLLLVSRVGNGFTVPEVEIIANTRKGKQVMNVKLPDEALLCAAIGEGDDHLAIVGENRKMLVFPLDQLPEMTRGKGVRLQKYKDGGAKDARTFKMADGLTWQDSAERTFTKSKDELARMDGRTRPGRPHGSKGLSEEWQVRSLAKKKKVGWRSF